MGKTEHSHQHSHSLDPLLNACNDSDALTTSWLKHGERMNRIQRIGHGMMSILFLLIGLSLANGSLAILADRSYFMSILFATAAGFALVLGLMGVRNVLRFKR